MDPDEVDWAMYAADAAEEEEYTRMSERDDDAIEKMASKMFDETMVTKDLDEVRDGLFRTQFKDAYCYEGGPEAYWTALVVEWKKVSGGKPVPTKYRTNKSVILKAYRLDSTLSAWWDDSGASAKTEVLGKTAVQHKCMAVMKVTRTAEGQARAIINTLEQYAKDAPAAEVKSCFELVHEWCEVRLS